MIKEEFTAKTTGILLMNLGTPSASTSRKIKHWLVEFLMDEEVISLPWLLRTLLVRGIIQYTKSLSLSAAYSRIWTDEGSPLLVNMRELALRMEKLGGMKVVVGMRYGLPNLREAFARLHIKGIKNVLVAPLYPQYATATTRSGWNKAKQVAEEWDMSLTCLPPFYNDPGYTGALAKSIAEPLATCDALLFSYHGLPEQQVRRASPDCILECTIDQDCCEGNRCAQATCYKYQAMATSKAVAKQLNLGGKPYFVSFQSRFGMAKWLQPFTAKMLAELPAKGITKLCVVSPSFVTDNLETLDELNIRGRKTFMDAGGSVFNFVPCLNAGEDWVMALNSLCMLALSVDTEVVAQPQLHNIN